MLPNILLTGTTPAAWSPGRNRARRRIGLPDESPSHRGYSCRGSLVDPQSMPYLVFPCSMATDDAICGLATSSSMVWFDERLAEARRPGGPRGPEIAATDRHGRRAVASRGGPHHDERPPAAESGGGSGTSAPWRLCVEKREPCRRSSPCTVRRDARQTTTRRAALDPIPDPNCEKLPPRLPNTNPMQPLQTVPLITRKRNQAWGPATRRQSNPN